MVDPIKDKILKRLQEGQTLEEIKQRVIDAGGWNSAVERSFAEAQDEFQKKNSTSEQPSTSEETSMESPSTIDGAQPTEEVSSDSDSDNQVVRFAKLDRIQAENAALWEEANKIQEVSKKEEVTDEDVLDFMGATPEPNFFQKLFGIEAEEDQALQDAVGTRTINKVILESEAKKVKETEEDVNQTYERLQNVNAATLNELWKDASPESAPLYNEVVDENGDTKLELSYKTTFDLQKQLREKEQFELERVAEKQKDVEAISDALPAGRFIYDLGTGVLDLGNSFLTFFDTEAAQTALYDSQFRTQASYNAAGLTEEEIKQGLYQNLEEGDWSNFGKLFSTQMAQTTPQLAAQAAIAYATRGFGSTAATVSSSAFMGLSTFGRTYAQTNGLVDSETQFIMSLGDAVVETMSEYLLSSDVKLVAGIEQGFKGMTRSQIRRELFQKGVISKEMKNLLGAEAKVFASSAVEEGFEELLAGVGSAVVHGIANNEEINAYEILDGMIVGFGMGGAAAGKRNSVRLLSGGASAMGFGGFRSDLIKTQGAKQKLAAELRNTRDSSKAAIIQSKIDELNKIELATRTEQNKIYDSYSDEDAETTVKANQTLKKTISESRTETDPKKKAELKKTATEALNTIKEIEGKYEGEIAQFRQERKAIGSINYGKDKRIDLNATEDMQGSKIMQSLKNVAKALGSPVFAYGSYNDMAEALGVNIEEVSNSRGIFESKDGSIHIMTPAALDNTAFHEGIHKIARGVDSKYIQRFVDAAIDGMPEGLAEKYSDFAKQYEGDKDLYYEELFAEMSADIATGAISIEGFGGSLASAAMRPVIKTIQKAGMLTNKNTASFSEFVEYVQSVTNSFKKGERIEVDSPVRKMHDKLAGLMSQLVSPKTEMKSPAEIYGDFDPSKSSTFANMTTDGNGNFVFLHVSPNKFDAVDPTRVGSNLATSGEETRQINAARAGGVSMFYTASEDVDVVGSNRYHYTVDPSKVYNGVDDSQGLYEMAKSQIEAMGLGAAQNTVYAKMTQIANQMGYDMVVMPWKDGSLKAQTTKRLPVEEAQQSYKSNKSQWTAVKGKTFDARRVMNDTANALYDKIRDIAEISESIKEQVRKYGFQSMDGRFGAPSSFADFLSSMQKLADGLDPANAAVFNQSIEEARGQESSEDVSGYSTRKQSAEARKKLEENISKEFEGETMGFTFNPITGEAVFAGIAVADGINENVLGDPNKGISPEVLDKINQEALKNPKGNVGGWIQDGEFFLDVSEVYDIEATAYRLGDERGEIGIYNIGEQKYIEIDRSKSTLFKQKANENILSEIAELKEKTNSLRNKQWKDEWESTLRLKSPQDVADMFNKVVNFRDRKKYEPFIDAKVSDILMMDDISFKSKSSSLKSNDVAKVLAKSKSELAPLINNLMSKGLFDNSYTYIANEGQTEMFVRKNGKSSGGFFNVINDNSVFLNPETNVDFGYIFLHEQIHRISVIEMLENDNYRAAMVSIFDEISNTSDKNMFGGSIMKEYGMTNEYEMIAEAFSNRKFQQLLLNFKVSPELKARLNSLGYDSESNLFDTIISFVKNIFKRFGADTKGTMLEAIISVNTSEFEKRRDSDEVAVEPSNESIRPPSPTLMRQAMSLKEQLEEMGLDPVEVMVEQMNRIGNEAKIDYKYKTETEPESDKINLADLKRRTGKTYKGLNYKDWQGIPMIFSISDQLTTGDVVNPYTGNLITNLMGGLGFHGASKKHSKLGWANIEDQKALDQINSAKEVYRKNKEVYDKAWESGKIPRGHVLMGIVRMGNSSMESNEAVLRVLYDNLSDFPLENKQKALKAFIKRANNIIKENEQAIETGIGKKGEKLTRATIKQKQTANEHLKDILSNIESQGITDISQTLNTKFLKGLKTIAAVAQLSNNITYGGAFTVGEENPKAGKPTKAPAAALLEGLPESERKKVHLGYIMDVITEPQMRNVPQRSLAMLTSIDITENGGLGDSDHPNYPAAAKGKVIGVFKNPESVVNLFPEIQSQLALFAAFEGVKGKKMSTSKRFTQRVPVQAGLANIEFRGASIKLNPTNAERLSTILYRAFPDFKLSTGVDVFTELINNSTAMNKMKTASGKIWGVRRGNRIFINEDVHNSESELFNTKINEMGQIWINYLSVKTDPKSKAILETGFELTRGTKEYKEQLKKHNGNEELALVDALSALIAAKGQSIVDAVKRSNFKDWVLGMFAYIKSALIPSSSVKKEQIENMTLNEFLNMAITDVMGGLTFKATEKQKEKAQVNIDSRESTIMRQAGVYQYIKDLVEMGFKKSEIVQEMLDLGYTKADAELVYQKALSYNQGSKAGYRAGVKDRNARFVEERKERLKNEREESKLWRKRAKELYRREKRVTDAMVDEAIKFLTGLKGVSIKPAQVKAILRMMKSANNKIHGNGAKQARNYGIFVSFVDAVAAVIDKQIEAKNLEEHSKLIRKVTAQQKKLMGRVKKLSPSSRSPIASYINQITDLASVDAGLLSFESLQTLANALNDLENTAKAVGVKTTKEGKVLSKPYIYIESIDDYVDVRKAKVYFDEVFAEVNVEAEQRLEAMLMEQAVKMSIDNGGNWLSIYQELLRQRDMTPIQKKLEAIADELGLDLNDVDGLLAALDKLEEQKQEDKKETRDVIIDDAIMSTFEKWRTLLMSNEDFAMIFGFDEDADFDSAMRKSRARLEKLTLTELKKLEFFMFDFIANGKTYGLQSLSAVAVAKNEGNARLRELKMTASETTGAGSSVREGYYKLFETTPTFFRRIFKRYSQASVAKFMNAIGFGSMRNNVAQAEAKAAAFAKMVQNMLSNKKLDNQKSQTRMLIYSVLSQKPEGVTDAAWVIQLKNSMDIAITNDKRLSDDDIKQIKEAMELFGTGTTSKNLSDIMSELEKDTDLVEAVGIIRDMFKSQEPRIKDYAENFLGMQFKEEANYLPLGFRKIASTSQNIDEILEKTNDISRAFRQHAQSKAQAVAGAVYERNQDALKSNKMYIDLNMYSMLERTYTENEVKSRTARDVATISAMTSENNKDFVNAVPSAELRSQIRKKVYNYLVNVSEYQAADEVLGKRGKKFANYMTSLTVVSFFGASIEQIVKQSSALMNALIETRSMAARLEYIEAIADAITPAFVRGEKSWAIHNDKRRLMENFGISRRDVVTETLSVSDGKKIGTKSRFDRGVELSTAALRETDKVAATATWLAYYVDYLISEEGKKADDIDWAAEAANPNLDAGQFADQMTVKDQNINSRRDKSRINEMTKGSALNLVKMVAMPFANFLLNKKMNLALDFQKLTMGDAKNRKEGLLSLAGTLAEVTAFQASTWMLLAPLYQAVANALFGDDEEESWWDKNFGVQMVKRGLIMDLIPTPPIAAVENYVLKGINMATYALTADSEDFVFADEDWSKGFERWERLNGLPIFKGQGRGDMNIGGFLGMLGVTGSVAHEMYLSASNIESLSGKQPYYTSKSGQKRFISRDDASKMLLIEFLRTSVNATMAVTGLHSKELSKILKEGKKPIEKRSTADQEQWIAKEIMSDAPAGIEDMLGYMAKEIEGDPTNAMGKVDQIIKKAKGSMVDDLVSAKNINTMRIIDKSETSNRGRAVYIHQIAQSLPEEERAQFYIDSYIYFGVKYGVETVKSQMLTEILKY